MIGRVFAALFVLAAIAALLLAFTGAGRGLLMRFAYQQAGLTSEVITPPGAYYRYKTVLKVDGAEELVFDNVVACNTRITRSKAHGSSVLNGITPNLFIKRTKDNHAVLVVTPKLCTWARTNTHEKNYTIEGFLPPGVVWFEDADDLTFGIAYVTKAAYAGPKSRLDLVSTYVGPANREEFETWYDGPRKENLAKQEWIGPPPGTTRARYDAHNAYVKEALATRGRAFPLACRGAHRLKLTETARMLIRRYWPLDKPRYWTPTQDEWAELHEMQFAGKPHFVGTSGNIGHSLQFWTGTTVSNSFGPNPEKYQGGWPAETYPAASSQYDLTQTEDSSDKDHFVQKVYFDNGANNGFAWCYFTTGTPSFHYDDPNRRSHYAAVDDNRARSGDGFKNQIKLFFERDQQMFQFFKFGIHPNGGIE